MKPRPVRERDRRSPRWDQSSQRARIPDPCELHRCTHASPPGLRTATHDLSSTGNPYKSDISTGSITVPRRSQGAWELRESVTSHQGKLLTSQSLLRYPMSPHIRSCIQEDLFNMTYRQNQPRRSMPSRSPSASFNPVSRLPGWLVAVGHAAVTAGIACHIGGMTAGALILSTTIVFCKLARNRVQTAAPKTRTVSAPRPLGLPRN